MVKNVGGEAVPEVDLVVQGDRHIDPDLLAQIKKRGDVFDVVRGQAKRFPIHNALRAGVLTSGLATGLLGSIQSPEPRHMAYGAIAAGAAGTSRRFGNRRRGRKVHKILAANEAVARETGEPLELIRQNARSKKDRDVQLYWGVELAEDVQPNEVRSRLESVAEIASDSSLKTVVIPDDVLAFVDEDTRAAYQGRTQKISDWLKGTKKRMPIGQDRQDGESKKQVLTLMPSECLELASHMEQLNQDPRAFEYAWQILKQERPTHVMFKQYAAQYKHLADLSRRNGIHNQARQTIANHIALALDDTAVGRGSNYERVRIDMRGTIDTKRPMVRLQGAQAIDSVHGQESVHAEDTGSLLPHLGIEPIDLKLFFESPGKLSEKKRVQAAEIVLLYELAGWDLPYTPSSNLEIAEDGHSSVLASDSSPALQQSVAARLGVTSKRLRRQLSDDDWEAASRIGLERLAFRRTARLGAALLLAFALSSESGGDAVYAPVNYLWDKREAQYIQDLPNRDLDEILDRVNEGQTPPYTMDRQKVEAAIQKMQETGELDWGLADDFRKEQPQDPYSWLLSNGFEWDRKIQDFIQDLSGASGVDDQFSSDGEADADRENTRQNTEDLEQQDNAAIGNIDSSAKNKPLWKLESNGMSTSGFWAQSTHNALIAGSDDGMFWQVSYNSTTKTKLIESSSPTEVEATDEWIRVESVSPIKMNRSYFYSEDALLSIPILEGTVPASVILHTGSHGSNRTTGVEGQILQLEDGTFMAGIEGGYRELDGDKVFVEYLLVPADSRPPMPFGSVHATSDIMTDSLITFDSEGNPLKRDLKLSDADDRVDDYVSGLPKDGLERTKALEQYIRNNFDYALAPFEEGGGEESKQDITGYVDRVFAAEVANCNVANTLLAVDNPELNVVTGYRNNPDPRSEYDSLSLADGHMVAADEDGTIYDATPGGVSPEDAAFFAEDFTAEDFEQPASSADEWRERFDMAKKIATVGAIGLAAAYVTRRRKQIAEAAMSTKQLMINVRGKVAEKRLNHIMTARPQAVRVATEVIGHAIFSGQPKAKKPVTRFDTLTPLESESVRRTLRASDSQGSARVRVKTAAQQGAFDTREKAAVKLARQLLRLNQYADKRVK